MQGGCSRVGLTVFSYNKYLCAECEFDGVAAYVLRDERVSSPVGPAGHSLVRLGECNSARGPGRWGSLLLRCKLSRKEGKVL